MMLAMSIAKMIHNTECVFFYNTPNSITPSELFTSTKYTLSPWIFTELEVTKIIKIRRPEEHRILSKALIGESSWQFSYDELSVEYDVDLSHLINLGADFLNYWEKNKSSFQGDKCLALDYLYDNCGTVKVKRSRING